MVRTDGDKDDEVPSGVVLLNRIEADNRYQVEPVDPYRYQKEEHKLQLWECS